LPSWMLWVEHFLTFCMTDCVYFDRLHKSGHISLACAEYKIRRCLHIYVMHVRTCMQENLQKK
jgi:hypothetical protein